MGELGSTPSENTLFVIGLGLAGVSRSGRWRVGRLLEWATNLFFFVPIGYL